MVADSDKTKQNIIQTHDVLKTIYFVVVGFSIIKALEILTRAFSVIKTDERVIIVTLFISFLVTIVRFCQGVSRVLAEEKIYVISDFYGFFLQGIGFFFIAININNINSFIFGFLFMLFVDSAWLIYIFCNNDCTFTKVERQWLHSNFVIIILWAILLIIMFFNHYPRKEITLSILILVISIVAACFDERKNKDYYMGKSAGQRTKFLLKPYFKNFISFIMKG